MSPDRLLRRSEISTKAKNAVDLQGRYPRILQDVSRQTGFAAENSEPFSKSTWWGKKVGAVMFRGALNQSPAVVKIEGVKLDSDEITEAAMIAHAQKALQGSGIRPPEVLQEIPWTDADGGYSAVIMEGVVGVPVLPVPGSSEQIADLLAIRDRYRKALGDNQVVPWVEKEGTLPDAIGAKFASWRQSAQELFPNHSYRQAEDAQLIDKAVLLLQKEYQGVEPEFMQGHFSHRDIVQVGQDIVMFSNLYWSYRPPFYDMVFPYHWYMLELAGKPGTTVAELQMQQGYWEKEFAKREATMTPEEKRLFRLARIERLAAAVNLDCLSISSDPDNKLAQFIMDLMRQQLRSLLTV